MSEQNASVAQAYAITEHFSERARRTAAAQTYKPTYCGGVLTVPYTMPRCTYQGIECCPIGVMRIVDGQRSGHVGVETPTPMDIARDLVPDDGQDGRLAQITHLAIQAGLFTNHWDYGVLPPERLAEALRVVPPSQDEQTHGDD